MSASFPIVPVSNSSARRRILPVTFAWLTGALAIAFSGWLGSAPPALIPVAIWAPVIVAVVLYRATPTLRAYVDTLPLSGLIGFHGIRLLFGVAFLVQMAKGTLPVAFAQPAGWGDIGIGTLAIPVAVLCSGRWRHRRVAALAWNVLGLVDILIAFASAQRLIFLVGDPRMAATLGQPPFSVVPLLIVPLILMTHLALFARLLGRESGS